MSLMFKRSLATCMRLCQEGGKPLNRFQAQYNKPKLSPSSSSTRPSSRPPSRPIKNNDGGGPRFNAGRPNHNSQGNHGNKNYRNNGSYYQRNNNDRGSYNQRNNNDKFSQRTSNRYSDPRNFRFSTGSETAKAAIASVISKIGNNSPTFNIQLVTDTGLIEKNLYPILVDLDLSKQGIQYVERAGEQLPLVKIVLSAEMTSGYSDELAKIRQMELIEMGNAKTLRTMETKLRQEQKKSYTKELSIKWNISLNDLKNQKRLEIEKTIKNCKKSGFLLHVVYEKGGNNSGNSVKTIYNDPEGLEIEMKKRENLKKILEDEILTPSECNWTMEGNIETKLVYNIIPKQTQQKQKQQEGKDQSSVKDIKKEKKIKEQPKGKGKGKGKPKSATSEEELDDLYLFKIED